ncbi:MAG: enoyl-CoA hydratase [Dehalococcoidia bacterium]|nr:enoyl-CoA hydratase [Dehalococcoidia bacterium]
MQRRRRIMVQLTSNAVKYEKKGRVAWITLNRPENMNARNSALEVGVRETFTEASNDDDVLVVIMTGEGGRAFCAGGDLKERAQNEAGGDLFTRPTTGGYPLNCPKPVVAAIDGYALAGGMQFAAQCDVRIATQKSQFGMPESRRSLTPVGGWDTPERYFPLGEALWMLLSGTNQITADRAYQLGFVQFLVPDRAALFEKAEWCAEELMMAAPLAVKALKYVAVHARFFPPEIAREYGRNLMDKVASSEDRLEGPRAFAEKRRPNWRMR